MAADYSSLVARRWDDLVNAHVRDAGGWALVSENELSLIKRAAGLEVELEQREGRMSQGEAIDLGEYGTACNTLRRLLTSIGLKRVAKPVETLRERLQREADAKADQKRQAALTKPEWMRS
jgi:hypothetical protein